MIELLTHANHLDNLNCADGKVPSYDSRKYPAEPPEAHSGASN